MASLERTAYPRFPRTLTLKDLQTSFTPTAEEIHWVNSKARGAEMRAALGTLLKCFQYLHYFPGVESIPPEVVQHVCATLLERKLAPKRFLQRQVHAHSAQRLKSRSARP